MNTSDKTGQPEKRSDEKDKEVLKICAQCGDLRNEEEFSPKPFRRIKNRI